MIDILFRGMSATPKFIIGATLILVSFILSTFPIEEIIFNRLKCWKKTSNDDVESSETHKMRL